jgi:hypothetical protein
MSKSTRQISNSKPLPNGNTSAPIILPQRRNKSIENKNFNSCFERGKQFYNNNKMAQAI